MRMFNKMIEDDAGLVKVKSRIGYDKYSNRIVFMVGFGEVVEVDNVKLCRMFGMQRDVYTLTNSMMGKKIFVMPQPCDFNVNMTTMFVYSNIAASSLLGNTFAPLLCTIHLEIDDKMERLHKNYTTIHYFPVCTSEFDTIEVQLCNVYGDNMVFYGGNLLSTSIFEKLAKKCSCKTRKGDIRAETVSEKMKWSQSDYEAIIGLRKERQKKKKRQKKKLTGGALHPTKALLHSIMLAKLLGRAIAATLTKSNMNGMGRLWKKFLNSKYPLQIKQLIWDKKLIDLFFDTRIHLDMRRRIMAQEGGSLGFLLPLITKVPAPLFGFVAHKLFS